MDEFSKIHPFIKALIMDCLQQIDYSSNNL